MHQIFELPTIPNMHPIQKFSDKPRFLVQSTIFLFSVVLGGIHYNVSVGLLRVSMSSIDEFHFGFSLLCTHTCPRM